jgi:hypothetical protein
VSGTACADDAKARAKATAINLIISFSPFCLVKPGLSVIGAEGPLPMMCKRTTSGANEKRQRHLKPKCPGGFYEEDGVQPQPPNGLDPAQHGVVAIFFHYGVWTALEALGSS